MSNWQPMETAPRDGTPILGWCVHEADPYQEGDRLTTYGAHAEGLSRVDDGPHVLVWGGEYSERDWESGRDEYIPAWWFLSTSEFEVVGNPVLWSPIEKPEGV